MGYETTNEWSKYDTKATKKHCDKYLGELHVFNWVGLAADQKRQRNLILCPPETLQVKPLIKISI